MLYKKSIITIMLVSLPMIGFAEVKKLDPSGPHCSKANGISQGFGEYVAGKMKVPLSSVSLIRASKDAYGDCAVTVDTAKGPQSCIGANVYTDGKKFWIGGGCI